MNRSMSRAITEEEIRTFQQDGIVCLPGVLDQEWVERLRDALDRVPGTYTTRSLMWTFDDTSASSRLTHRLARLPPP